MTKFNLFDTVKLTEEISLFNGKVAPSGTTGIIVEIYNYGEAYEVELFGDWVKYDQMGNFIPSKQDESDAFVETIGLATVYPHQFHLIKTAAETVSIRAQLLALLDELSEDSLAEIKDFAEFIKYKQNQLLNIST